MKKNKFLGFNILITSIWILLLIIGFWMTVAYELPDRSEIKTATGIVSDFKQRDGKWYDYLFGGGKHTYFNIWLSDDSFYEATGINYDNIDRKLYETIRKGEEITISYIDNGWTSPNDIVSIEYDGISYLKLTDVIEDYEKTNKSMKIVGFCVIGVTSLSAIGLYILNYKKNKVKKQEINS